MKRSWKEVLEGRGVNFDEIAKRIRREENGCVIRALESIANTQATEQEWELRLAQIDALREVPIVDQFANEEKSIQLLIKQSITGQTRIGKALIGRPLTIDAITPDEMKVKITRGDDLMIIGPFRQGNTYGCHAAHIDYDNQQGFIEKSENGSPLQLKEGGRFRVFIFGNR